MGGDIIRGSAQRLIVCGDGLGVALRRLIVLRQSGLQVSETFQRIPLVVVGRDIIRSLAQRLSYAVMAWA